MDSMAAQAGMGPATGPLTVIRKVRRRRLVDLPTDRTLVMGILNVTHNSFSDGGDYLDTETAIEQGLRLHYSGADLIDVGGESTRPGAEAIDPLLEQNRVLHAPVDDVHALDAVARRIERREVGGAQVGPAGPAWRRGRTGDLIPCWRGWRRDEPAPLGATSGGGRTSTSPTRRRR